MPFAHHEQRESPPRETHLHDPLNFLNSLNGFITPSVPTPLRLCGNFASWRETHRSPQWYAEFHGFYAAAPHETGLFSSNVVAATAGLLNKPLKTYLIIFLRYKFL